MSRENVERIREALDALRRDGPGAILGNLDPDIEWIADRSDMGRVVYRGREGVARSFAELSEGFEDFGFRADRFIDAGDRTVAVGQMYGLGRTTGIRAEIPLGILFTHGADGRLVRYESFRNPAAALEAVGLAE
jgi:ketosteroid isomerase-like protein